MQSLKLFFMLKIQCEHPSGHYWWFDRDSSIDSLAITNSSGSSAASFSLAASAIGPNSTTGLRNPAMGEDKAYNQDFTAEVICFSLTKLQNGYINGNKRSFSYKRGLKRIKEVLTDDSKQHFQILDCGLSHKSWWFNWVIFLEQCVGGNLCLWWAHFSNVLNISQLSVWVCRDFH